MISTTLEKRKANLIVRISRLDREESVEKVEEAVGLVETHTTGRQLETLKKIVKPAIKKLDIDQMIREQNWKPSSPAEIDALIEDFDWQISDDDFSELLKDL